MSTADGRRWVHDPLCPMTTHPCRGNRAAGGSMLWQRLRIQILIRDHWTCTYCGKPLLGPDATVDHVIPMPSLDPSNLVAACRRCNSREGRGAHALDADTGEYCVLDGCDDRCQCILIEGVRRQGREREVLCKACALPWCGCAEIDDAYARGLRDAAGASGSYLDGRRDAAAAIEAFLHCDPCDCVHCSLLTVVSNAALGTAIDPGAGR